MEDEEEEDVAELLDRIKIRREESMQCFHDDAVKLEQCIPRVDDKLQTLKTDPQKYGQMQLVCA